MTSGCWIEALGVTSTKRWMLVLITVPLFADSFQAMDLKRLYVTYIRQLYHPFLWVGTMKSSKIMGNPYFQPTSMVRNGIHGIFSVSLGTLKPPGPVEVLQKVRTWRKTVRVLPLIVWVIVQAQHPWSFGFGFHGFQIWNDLLRGVPDIEIYNVQPDMKDVCWLYLCL